MFMTIKKFMAVIIGLFLQLGFAIYIRMFFEQHLMIINVFYTILSVLIVLAILKDSTKLSNDIPWIILILLFPIFASILLITLGKDYSKGKLMKSILKEEEKNLKYLEQDPKIRKEIETKKMDNLKYLMNVAKYPVTKNNKIKYYDMGEKFYKDLLVELKNAKEYIFMEYFIIKEGVMWNGILDILKKKALEGVEVRILYDDIGSLSLLPKMFPNELNEHGIKCIPFNILTPVKGIFMNNRDHRKVTIIDGKIAFTGGVNLSDEYINKEERFGIWKDNAVKIEGDAVWNMTAMFLSLWNANQDEDKNISKFKKEFKDIKSNGYMVTFGDGPLDDELVAENAYINIINSAKDYIYIMSPYLIIDTDMVNSLIRAAKRGVDVRIIVPGIPDKKIVYTLTRSFFKILHEGGVNIYKYKDGFIHSKVFLSDDDKGLVGTINLDYRSLYLHFENGVYMENVKELKDIKKDFTDTFKVCTLITDKDVKTNVLKNIWEAILRLFAPLF